MEWIQSFSIFIQFCIVLILEKQSIWNDAAMQSVPRNPTKQEIACDEFKLSKYGCIDDQRSSIKVNRHSYPMAVNRNCIILGAASVTRRIISLLVSNRANWLVISSWTLTILVTYCIQTDSRSMKIDDYNYTVEENKKHRYLGTCMVNLHLWCFNPQYMLTQKTM